MGFFAKRPQRPARFRTLEKKQGKRRKKTKKNFKSLKIWSVFFFDWKNIQRIGKGLGLSEIWNLFRFIYESHSRALEESSSVWNEITLRYSLKRFNPIFKFHRAFLVPVFIISLFWKTIFFFFFWRKKEMHD